MHWSTSRYLFLFIYFPFAIDQSFVAVSSNYCLWKLVSLRLLKMLMGATHGRRKCSYDLVWIDGF